MTIRRLSIRPLVVGSMAVLFALYLALGGSSVANAQELPELDDPELDDPETEDPGGLLDDLTEGELLDLENLLDLEGLDLDDLTLDELLALLDLLGTDDAPPPLALEPLPEPAPVAPAPAAPAPAPAAQQVTQRPVGGVAAGAGGASDQGATSAPLLALGALALAGAGAAVRKQAAQV